MEFLKLSVLIINSNDLVTLRNRSDIISRRIISTLEAGIQKSGFHFIYNVSRQTTISKSDNDRVWMKYSRQQEKIDFIRFYRCSREKYLGAT